MLQQASQLHGDLGESEPTTTEDLGRVPKMPFRERGKVGPRRGCVKNVAESELSGTLGQQARPGLQDQGAFPANLAEVTVAVDVLALMPVLQLVVFDVKPQGLHDGSPRLCVHSQQPCQSGVQLVLRRLGIKGS